MIQSIYHFHSKEGINMNKIYKVIWSKAKHTYVVASEIAKGHTKGETTGRGLKKTGSGHAGGSSPSEPQLRLG